MLFGCPSQRDPENAIINSVIFSPRSRDERSRKHEILESRARFVSRVDDDDGKGKNVRNPITIADGAMGKQEGKFKKCHTWSCEESFAVCSPEKKKCKKIKPKRRQSNKHTKLRTEIFSTRKCLFSLSCRRRRVWAFSPAKTDRKAGEKRQQNL